MTAASKSTDLNDLLKGADDTPEEKKAVVKWTQARYKRAADHLVYVSHILGQVATKPGGITDHTTDTVKSYRDTIDALRVLITVAGKKPSVKGKVKQ